MNQARVRMLLVRDAGGQIVGLLTSRDVEGEKPGRILAKAGGTWEDLLVADIMTLKPKLEVLLLEEVEKARVGRHHRHLPPGRPPARDGGGQRSRDGKPAVRGISPCRRSACCSAWTSIRRGSRHLRRVGAGWNRLSIASTDLLTSSE